MCVCECVLRLRIYYYLLNLPPQVREALEFSESWNSRCPGSLDGRQLAVKPTGPHKGNSQGKRQTIRAADARPYRPKPMVA